MLRKKRLLTGAALSTVVAASLMLSGCSGGSGGSAEPTASYDPHQKVTLHVSWWGNDTRSAIMSKVIGMFEKKYPQISVVPEPVGAPDDLFNRLSTDFASGTAPDVFALGGSKPQDYGAAGSLLDLSTVEPYLSTKEYPASALTSSTVDGKLYGLPTGGNAIGLLINEDLFTKAGVPLPTSSWTWDDFVSAADDISQNAGNGVVGLDLRVQDVLGTYVAQGNKLGIYTAKGKLAVKAPTIQKWYDLEKKLIKGGGLPDPSVIVQHWNVTPDRSLFGTGKAAMSFAYSNQLAAYSAGTNGAKIEIVQPPTDTSSTGVSVLPSQFWAIAAGTKYPAQSALLVNFLLNNKDSAKVILADRGLPFNPEILSVVKPLLNETDAASAKYLEDALKVGVVSPPQPAGGAILNDLSQRTESDILFGKTSSQKGSESWISQLQQSLATDG
ncbi:ABC transporter substrate-binding protein [Diaminobutyricibacter sp. McL0608]|uniref:ABC transporter substrate-binding protein n=1 Tax=Leifsonia sp. McL0608 TaxID=3143537 RepID=UPI0031F32436